MIRNIVPALALFAVMAGGGIAQAGELPIGDPMEKNGMELQGIFLQAVMMEPATAGQEPEKTDIHLEIDIVTLKGNENGFAAGSWVPYLGVYYMMTKTGSDWTSKGHLHGMVAADGPHYGANVKLDGPGEYTVTFHIQPPSVNGFKRHFDKETGVGPWWKPFDYSGSFIFAGTGKKGSY
jgi:hypothetical protein